MWLLYKAKHPKVNGCSLITQQSQNSDFATNLAFLLNETQEQDAILSLVNRYLNLFFDQNLPEDLPHIPSWLLAAQAYSWLVANANSTELVNETEVLQDIVNVGEIILEYIESLAKNQDLQVLLNCDLQRTFSALNERLQVLLSADQFCWGKLQETYAKLRLEPKRWLADSANEQLEYFSPMTVDVTELFNQHILPHISDELIAAHHYGLGKLQIQFSIDAHTNTFMDLHTPYSDNLLPDYARDVIFKIETYFKATNTDAHYLLATSWFAHDLRTAANRFEDYYNGKFKFKLKHKRYHWISLDGRANQVEGHPNTLTHKLIDHERLADIYSKWLGKVKPANDPELQQRLLQNYKFKQTALLLSETNSCTVLETQQAEFLRNVLSKEIPSLLLRQRQAMILELQRDADLRSITVKIEALYSVLSVFGYLLNEPFVVGKISKDFNDFWFAMSSDSNLELDAMQQLKELLMPKDFLLVNPQAYQQGELYKRVQAALAGLRILHNELTISRLRIF